MQEIADMPCRIQAGRPELKSIIFPIAYYLRKGVRETQAYATGTHPDLATDNLNTMYQKENLYITPDNFSVQTKYLYGLKLLEMLCRGNKMTTHLSEYPDYVLEQTANKVNIEIKQYRRAQKNKVIGFKVNVEEVKYYIRFALSFPDRLVYQDNQNAYTVDLPLSEKYYVMMLKLDIDYGYLESIEQTIKSLKDSFDLESDTTFEIIETAINDLVNFYINTNNSFQSENLLDLYQFLKNRLCSPFGRIVRLSHISQFKKLKDRGGQLITEAEFHKLLIQNSTVFLETLGREFALYRDEYNIRYRNRKYGKIDMVLYDITKQCMLLVELKVGRLNIDVISQMMQYILNFTPELSGIRGKKIVLITPSDPTYLELLVAHLNANVEMYFTQIK